MNGAETVLDDQLARDLLFVLSVAWSSEDLRDTGLRDMLAEADQSIHTAFNLDQEEKRMSDESAARAATLTPAAWDAMAHVLAREISMQREALDEGIWENFDWEEGFAHGLRHAAGALGVDHLVDEILDGEEGTA